MLSPFDELSVEAVVTDCCAVTATLKHTQATMYFIIPVTSSQEERVRVRTVNSHVTSRAVLKARIGQIVEAHRNRYTAAGSTCTRAVMTFQTHGEDHWPFEHARIGGPVRHVAGFAAVHTNGRVFEYEWASLFHVTTETCLLIKQLLRDHTRAAGHAPRWCERAVRIVAVGTAHEGHGKLRLNRWMTAVA